jgi:uncharacterized protein (DUF433 family)
MGEARHDRIVSDPQIMRGKPVVKGTRITVELLLEELGEGASIEEIVADYPNLTHEDVLAALRFALRQERGVSRPKSLTSPP